MAALRRGSVASFDALEAVLEYVLYDQLGWEYGDEGNVLLAEPLMTSKVSVRLPCLGSWCIFQGFRGRPTALPIDRSIIISPTEH